MDNAVITPKKIDEVLNEVFEADCLDKMQELPDHSVDMILCDLPYGTTQNNWDFTIPLEDYVEYDNQKFTEKDFFYKTVREAKGFSAIERMKDYWNNNNKPGLWSHYKRIIKDNGVIALTSNGVFTARLILSQTGLFKYKWVWEKSKATNFLNARNQPLRKHEDICIFYKKQPDYHPQMTEGEAYDKGIRKNQLTGSYGIFSPVRVQSEGSRYPYDLIYVKTAEAEGEVYHPTQKPVELGRYLIRTYTGKGDVVMDNTCGSGSFLVAALMEGRNFIGIEKNEGVKLFKRQTIDYISVCKGRLQASWNAMDIETRESIRKVNLINEFVLANCPLQF